MWGLVLREIPVPVLPDSISGWRFLSQTVDQTNDSVQRLVLSYYYNSACGILFLQHLLQFLQPLQVLLGNVNHHRLRFVFNVLCKGLIDFFYHEVRFIKNSLVVYRRLKESRFAFKSVDFHFFKICVSVILMHLNTEDLNSFQWYCQHFLWTRFTTFENDTTFDFHRTVPSSFTNSQFFFH